MAQSWQWKRSHENLYHFMKVFDIQTHTELCKIEIVSKLAYEIKEESLQCEPSVWVGDWVKMNMECMELAKYSYHINRSISHLAYVSICFLYIPHIPHIPYIPNISLSNKSHAPFLTINIHKSTQNSRNFGVDILRFVPTICTVSLPYLLLFIGIFLSYNLKEFLQAFAHLWFIFRWLTTCG